MVSHMPRTRFALSFGVERRGGRGGGGRVGGASAQPRCTNGAGEARTVSLWHLCRDVAGGDGVSPRRATGRCRGQRSLAASSRSPRKASPPSGRGRLTQRTPSTSTTTPSLHRQADLSLRSPEMRRRGSKVGGGGGFWCRRGRQAPRAIHLHKRQDQRSTQE